MKELNKSVLIWCILLFSISSCFAQNNDKDINVGFSAGQASDNSYTKSLPASLIAIYNANDTIGDSYSINGFLGFDLKIGNKDSPNWTISANAELHKNTLIAKEQNTVQFGISIKHLIPIFFEKKDKDKFYPAIMLSPEFSFKHSDNKIKDKQSMQYLGYLSLTLPRSFEDNNGKALPINFLRPNIIYPGDERANKNDSISKFGKYTSDWFQLKHFHSIGLENIANESLTLLNTSFGIEIYPLSGFLYDVFDQYGILQFRYAIANRKKLSSRDTDLYIGALTTTGVSLNYKFDEDGKTAISFGYEYNKGGNPLKGLEDVEFGQLKISALINL